MRVHPAETSPIRAGASANENEFDIDVPDDDDFDFKSEEEFRAFMEKMGSAAFGK